MFSLVRVLAAVGSTAFLFLRAGAGAGAGAGSAGCFAAFAFSFFALGPRFLLAVLEEEAMLELELYRLAALLLSSLWGVPLLAVLEEVAILEL